MAVPHPLGPPLTFPVGVELDADGAHPASWRFADHDPGRLFDPGFLRDRFGRLDAAGFGFVTLPDGSGRTPAPHEVRARLDTVETAAFAGAVTERLALVPAVNTAHAEPYHLANQLSSLERGAQGRAGWLAGALDDETVAAAYGQAPGRAVAAEARDVIATVRRLWDTWEDDVLIADLETQRFLDLDRWHHADVVTDTFSVKGPGLLPRPVQGQLPVWCEGVPDPLLAPLVDVAVVSAPTRTGLVQRVQEVRALGVPRVVVAVEVVLDARGTSARERLHLLDAWVPWPVRDRLRLLGSPVEVADGIARLAGLVDGVRLHPAVLDVDLPAIAGHLAPRPTTGTLRESLDLPRPENVFALERSAR